MDEAEKRGNELPARRELSKEDGISQCQVAAEMRRVFVDRPSPAIVSVTSEARSALGSASEEAAADALGQTFDGWIPGHFPGMPWYAELHAWNLAGERERRLPPSNRTSTPNPAW